LRAIILYADCHEGWHATLPDFDKMMFFFSATRLTFIFQPVFLRLISFLSEAHEIS